MEEFQITEADWREFNRLRDKIDGLRVAGMPYENSRESLSIGPPPVSPPFPGGGGGGAFPVSLVSDGGADGSNTGPVASTLTYTVKTPDGTTTIKTGVSVWMARQRGHVTAATKGYAQTIGGTLFVVMHDEILDAMNC